MVIRKEVSDRKIEHRIPQKFQPLVVVLIPFLRGRAVGERPLKPNLFSEGIAYGTLYPGIFLPASRRKGHSLLVALLSGYNVIPLNNPKSHGVTSSLSHCH